MLFKNNFNSRLAFDLGSRFNCMNYQKNDENLDDYITNLKIILFYLNQNKYNLKLLKKVKVLKKQLINIEIK